MCHLVTVVTDHVEQSFYLHTYVLDGINCLTARFVESYMSCPDTSSGMITSVLQHLHTTYNIRVPPPTTTTQQQLLMSSSNNETLMNFAPLGTSISLFL